MKLIKKIVIILVITSSLVSCKKYLDVVPDNIATIEYAFRMRTTAEKYLASCYSFIPQLSSVSYSPGLFSGDELWLPTYPFSDGGLTFSTEAWNIARGSQNINSPLLDYWNGDNMNRPMWRAIRECNIFLENINSVPDMEEQEKQQWIAEVKFLKAYYHFYLVTLYGPIPLMKENIPISAGVEEVKVSRRPVDECFDYIIQLLDEAVPALPPAVTDDNSELGRITMPIAKAMKAKVLVYAASPLFNGNPDYVGFNNKDGLALFNTAKSDQKWIKAAAACKEAVDACQTLGYELYQFQGNIQTSNISPETKTKLSIRNSFAEKWNRETIWANPNSTSVTLQYQATPRGLDPAAAANGNTRGNLGVPLKIAALFYTKNGLPITEDNTWDFSKRFELRTGTSSEKFNIKEGYTTAQFNFDREPRFYASLGFDGGIWYGQGKYDDKNALYLQSKVGQIHGQKSVGNIAITGYYPKKYVNYTSVANSTTYSVTNYPWIMIRLADLYLLTAEALNEASGPGAEVYGYLNLIRQRAGLPTVESAWSGPAAKHPNKHLTKEGLREIIHQERNNELALEGHRFFDLRRWKEAPEEYNAPITGWDSSQESEEAYYREKTIYRQTFSLKDYFWPIQQSDLIVNKNLVQNPGW